MFKLSFLFLVETMVSMPKHCQSSVSRSEIEGLSSMTNYLDRPKITSKSSFRAPETTQQQKIVSIDLNRISILYTRKYKFKREQ